MLLGNTKWVLDFLQHTLNELLELANEFESVSSDEEAFSQKRAFCLIFPANQH